MSATSAPASSTRLPPRTHPTPLLSTTTAERERGEERQGRRGVGVGDDVRSSGSAARMARREAAASCTLASPAF
eukprot:2994251-Rhodomonas_salina.1